jgi:hypothetical protein
MTGRAIPADVKQEVEAHVAMFNRKELARSNRAYSVRFHGRFAYLDRDDGPGPSPICRLEYMGKMTDWEFSIYKYSLDAMTPRSSGSGAILRLVQ